MASQTGVPNIVPQGVNNAVLRALEFILPAALSSTNTLTLTVPDGFPKSALPIAVQAYTTAAPKVAEATPSIAAGLTITSHNITTGVTVLTCGATGVGASDHIVILYADV